MNKQTEEYNDKSFTCKTCGNYYQYNSGSEVIHIYIFCDVCNNKWTVCMNHGLGSYGTNPRPKCTAYKNLCKKCRRVRTNSYN